MKVRNSKFALILLLFPLCAVIAISQTPSSQSSPPQTAAGSLRGTVTDPSGAAIADASVIMTPPAVSAAPIATKTDGQGAYEFKGVAAGQYSLTVVAPGFAVYENDNVVIAGQPLRLNVAMSIEVEQQKIQVSDTAPTVDINPENNAGAIIISGKELEALPDDPDELLTDLQALAGPSAGPNGGQLYIDGFTAGQLPPKSSIREIRINQNPFSAEYDKLGYGRIEIFTKPGTDNFHGQFQVSGNDAAFNSSDPFAGAEPGYYTVQYDGNVGGPIINKKASFFFTAQRRNINDLSAIDAVVLDQNFNPSPLVESIPTPHQRTNLSVRFDFAPSKDNTITARYQYYRDTETNNGIGQTVVPSQAYDTGSTEHTVQISDTQVIGAKIVNETRFQFLKDGSGETSVSVLPSVMVLGAFNGGGNGQISSDYQYHYELQNYTSVIHGSHIFKFGGRFRSLVENNSSNNGYNGIFTFSSLTQFQQAECATLAPPLPAACVGLPSATPQQLSITQPGPTISPAASLLANITVNDIGLYIQDDWKVRSNITFSYGMRYEAQNHIRDHADLAPRVGLAWGVGGKSGPPIVVIRGGAGIFYDRFQSTQILNAARLNGITQQQFIIDNPTCFPGLNQPLNFSTANCGPVSSVGSAIYQISPSLYAPYTIQAAFSAERQVTKSATLTVTYLSSRGFDQLLSINSTAPPPGTPCYPNCPVPSSNVYQYVSEGVYRQKQLIANTNIRVGTKLQLFGYYVLNYADSDTGGVSSFASNSYNISQDYGRAIFDVRQRLFLGGSVGIPHGVRLSPFMIVNAGTPFNITSPYDLNGDLQFNDRPAFAPAGTSCAAPDVYCTALGNFNAVPTAGQPLIPINYSTGPTHVTFNLRLGKTFGFGPKVKGGTTTGNQGGGPRFGGGGGGGGGARGPLFGGGPMNLGGSSERRYNFTISASARNIFNKVNLGAPGGVLGSPFFDKYNSLQGGPFSTGVAVRRIDLQASFSF